MYIALNLSANLSVRPCDQSSFRDSLARLRITCSVLTRLAFLAFIDFNLAVFPSKARFAVALHTAGFTIEDTAGPAIKYLVYYDNSIIMMFNFM